MKRMQFFSQSALQLFTTLLVVFSIMLCDVVSVSANINSSDYNGSSVKIDLVSYNGSIYKGFGSTYLENGSDYGESNNITNYSACTSTQDRIYFERTDKGKIFSKGSSIEINITDIMNIVDATNLSTGASTMVNFVQSSITSYIIYFMDSSGTYKQATASGSFTAGSSAGYYNLRISLDDVPCDSYKIIVSYHYNLSKAYGSTVSGYFGNTSKYEIIRYFGFYNSYFNFQEVLPDPQDELLKEQNKTANNIFEAIGNFFGSFFDNLIGAIVGVFIPEDGFFSDFFTRLNNFFSEKLGMLWTPIDMLIDILNAIMNADDVDATIMFPEVRFQEYVLIPETPVDICTYLAEIDGLQDTIYFVTNVAMVGAIIVLLQVKLKEVLST